MDIAEFRILGRIGKIDARERVTFLDVGSNYSRKVEGQWEDDPHWNRLTLFGQLRERAARFEVGDLLHATGRVRQSQYGEGDDRRYTVDLIADRVGVVARRSSRSGQGNLSQSDDSEN